jgi:hypothetical protein
MTCREIIALYSELKKEIGKSTRAKRWTVHILIVITAVQTIVTLKARSDFQEDVKIS